MFVDIWIIYVDASDSDTSSEWNILTLIKRKSSWSKKSQISLFSKLYANACAARLHSSWAKNSNYEFI